jgi:stage V sporulation protein D (sporulation-specific penicillin-binding protein)
MTISNRIYKKSIQNKLAERASEGKKSPFWRIYILTFFVFFASVSIVFRLYQLQVVAYASYRELATNQHLIFKKLIPQRGEIYLRDRDKNALYPVAVNKEYKMAYAVPKEIEDSEMAAEKISEALGIDKNEIISKLSDKEDMYEVLKHKLSDEEVDKLSNLKIEGIYLSGESFRYYPAGELASHLIGYMGWNENDFGGRNGVERFFDERLRGSQGSIFQSRDTFGRWIPTVDKEISQAKDGDSFVLTIDHILQFETERILKAAVEKYRSDRGTAIIMEVDTGKILAMASYPNYNPNNYGQVENIEAFRNVAVNDSYECGSVFKTFTLASAIDMDKINPDTTYYDSGAVSISKFKIKNSDGKAYGKQTMTQVLEKSLNTGAIYAEQMIGNKNFYDYIKKFGFGETTGIEIFGEPGGNLNQLSNLNRDTQFFTASFGQGFTVTPIQLVAAYNAIANGGKYQKPTMIEKIVRNDGSEEFPERPNPDQIISQRTAQNVGEMLESVVEKGHGKLAGVPGYLVGGKTGTAQVAARNARGYEEGKSIGSFVGFAPIGDPRYTLLIRIDNPKDVEWAESSAAPTFGELMKFVLEYENILPTENYTQADLDRFNATHNLRDFLVKMEDEEKEKKKEDGKNN